MKKLIKSFGVILILLISINIISGFSVKINNHEKNELIPEFDTNFMIESVKERALLNLNNEVQLLIDEYAPKSK